MSANLAAILITALVAFVLGAAGMRLLWKDHAGLEHRLTVVETKQAAEEERRLVPTKDHYRYNEIAAMRDIAAHTSALEAEIVEMTGRLNTIRLIANSIAKQPQKYDPEKPSKDQQL